MTVVLAIDPSLTALGWACDNGPNVIHGIVTSQPPTNEQRLLRLATAVRNLARDHNAQIVAIENLAYSMKSRSVTDLAGLHWTIRNILYGAQIPVAIVPSNIIKKYATGKGNAPKDQVLAAAIRRLGYTGHDNNESDALWLHALLSDALRQPVVTVPKTHRDALNTLTLPEPANP